MHRHPQVRLRIAGHVSLQELRQPSWTPSLAELISLIRAVVVRQAVVDCGVAPSRVSTVGWGAAAAQQKGGTWWDL